jgi:hypothetical protein
VFERELREEQSNKLKELENFISTKHTENIKEQQRLSNEMSQELEYIKQIKSELE